MSRFLLLLFSAIFLPSVQAGAQDTVQPGRADILLKDIRIVGHDWLKYGTAPASWTWNDALTAGGIIGGTAGLMFFDERIRDATIRDRRSDLYAASIDLAWTGNLVIADIASGLVYFSGLFSGDDHIRVTGRMMGQSLLYSGSVALMLRLLSGRRWPAANEGAFSFNAFPPDDTYHAFPSGHSVVVFSLATILAERIDYWPVSVLLYGTAIAAGLGRMYLDQHWASDVFLGSALGYTTARFVLAREKQRQSGNPETSRVTLHPQAGGVMLVVGF
ncbi:MAG: phosphatase PAP2 family protein [Bacteroidetes bacterium]|nr:phosphatase PAP2 family protein [Bacteroidota bacterium]